MTDRTCSIDGCERFFYAFGWCNTHYQRWRKHGTTDDLNRQMLDRVPCSVDGCERPSRARGWCPMHYQRWKRHGDLAGPAWADAPDGTKWCPQCESCKPLGDFSRSKATSSGVHAWCKKCWSEILASGKYASKRQAADRKRRARKLGANSEPYATQEIADRDGWICQLCRQRIGRALKWPNPRSLSIDHIVPFSKGGDDVKANVQASHLSCNIAKSNRGVDQLRLIG